MSKRVGFYDCHSIPAGCRVEQVWADESVLLRVYGRCFRSTPSALELVTGRETGGEAGR